MLLIWVLAVVGLTALSWAGVAIYDRLTTPGTPPGGSIDAPDDPVDDPGGNRVLEPVGAHH